MQKKYRVSDKAILIGFLVPALLVIAVSQGYPLIYSLYMSMMDWTLAKSAHPNEFVGFRQFAKLLDDPLFLKSVRLSSLVMVVATAVQVIIGFIVANLVVGGKRSLQVSRTLLLLPMVVAPIAVGTMWRLLYNTKSGFINTLLSSLHIKSPDWLGNPDLAIWSAIIVEIWEWMPFAMIIYVSAISSIDPSIKESAYIDGASGWAYIRKMVVPLVLPATLLILVFRMIDSFFVIDVFYSLTYGGPGTSTFVSSLYIYNQGLKYFNVSYAAAASWFLMLFSLLFAAVLLNWKKKVEGNRG